MKATTITRQKVFKGNKIAFIYTESFSDMQDSDLNNLKASIINRYGKKINIEICFNR